MSYANGTPFLNLPQTVGNDHRDWFDTNAAFLDLDAKMKTLWDGASSTAGILEQLQETVSRLDTDLAALTTTVNGHTTTLQTVNESLVLINSALTALNTDVSTKFDSAGIADPYDPTYGTYDVDDVVTYNGQRYKCVTAVAAAEPFDADKWLAEDVQTVINQINSDLSELSGDYEVTKNTVVNIATDVYSAGVALISSDITTPQDLTPSQPFTNFNTIKVRIGAYYTAQNTNIYMQAFDIDLRHLNGAANEFMYSWYISDTNFMCVAFGIQNGKLVINDIQLGTVTAQSFAVYVEAYGYKQTL